MAMTELEIREILEKANDYWPNTTVGEIALLRKRLEVYNLDKTQAAEILESVKLRSRFHTLPLPEIEKSLKKAKEGRNQPKEYTICYYLNTLTGKGGNVAVPKSIPEQEERLAREFLEKYQTQSGQYEDQYGVKHYVDSPENHVIFVGEENIELYHQAKKNWRKN